MSKRPSLCSCGKIDVLLDNRNSGFSFGSEGETVFFTFGNRSMVVKYCFSCGEQLPKAQTYLDPKEIEELQSLMSSIHSSEDILDVLGPADDIMKKDSDYFQELLHISNLWYDTDGHDIQEQECIYVFSTRWKTFTLYLTEYTDGRISSSYAPCKIQNGKRH